MFTITPLVGNKVEFTDSLVWEKDKDKIIISSGVVTEITQVELRSNGLVTVELKGYEEYSFPLDAVYLKDVEPINEKQIIEWPIQ